MTNSHNRASQKEGRNSERNNASPNHHKSNGSRKVTFFSDNNNHKTNNGGYFQQKHSNNNNNGNGNNHHNYHHSSQPKDIVSPMSAHHQKFINNSPSSAKDLCIMQNNNRNNHRYNNRNHHNGSPHGNGRNSPRSPISFASPAGVSKSPPNLTHFAGSKYFDAPSPNALPQPPSHWTFGTTATPTHPIPIQTAATFQTISTSTPLGNEQISKINMESTSKRRLFTNGNDLPKACSLSAAAQVADKHLSSDIFSHNLKLILNVQA